MSVVRLPSLSDESCPNPAEGSGTCTQVRRATSTGTMESRSNRSSRITSRRTLIGPTIILCRSCLRSRRVQLLPPHQNKINNNAAAAAAARARARVRVRMESVVQFVQMDPTNSAATANGNCTSRRMLLMAKKARARRARGARVRSTRLGDARC